MGSAYNAGMTFLEQLQTAERQNGSLLCVGLDPEPAKFPAAYRGDASKIYDFCAAMVEATADLVIAFKPQIAYFDLGFFGQFRFINVFVDDAGDFGQGLRRCFSWHGARGCQQHWNP